MNTAQRVTAFIELIRGPIMVADGIMDEQDTSRGIITEVFTNGNCGNFAQALALAFGGKVVLIEEAHHVVCWIEGRMYDITGDVSNKYLHMTPVVPSASKLEDMTNNYSFAERGPLI